MYPVFHDCNELLIAELAVAIIIKDVVDGINDVGTKTVPGADAHSSMELIW